MRVARYKLSKIPWGAYCNIREEALNKVEWSTIYI